MTVLPELQNMMLKLLQLFLIVATVTAVAVAE
jgi:hypothetical protein